jgi:putative DNA methylase
MPVRTALGLINQVLDETLAEQDADFDAETRWAVAWFEQYGMNAGPFGVAESLSKAKNTAMNGLVAAGILESKAGKVRLLERDELTGTWDPTTDKRLTVWEVAQYLIRALDNGGEIAAAALLRRVGGLGEAARELAYRLYVVCERKKWAKEAVAYNGLIVAWPEVSRASAQAPASTSTQQELL